MPDPSSSREAELSRQLQERDGQLHRSNEGLAQARREIELLREKIDLLVRKLFGAKSEKLDPAQLLLLLQGLDEDARGAERSETNCRRQPEGWSGGDIKSPGQYRRAAAGVALGTQHRGTGTVGANPRE